MNRTSLVVFFAGLFCVCLIGCVAIATESELVSRLSKDTISIEPQDEVLGEYPDAMNQCNHDYIVYTTGEVGRYQMDDYACCYVSISIDTKTCKACYAVGYDLHYEMVRHADQSGICSRCGRVPFIPAIEIPLT